MAASSADHDLLVAIVEAAAATEYDIAKMTKDGDGKSGELKNSTEIFIFHLKLRRAHKIGGGCLADMP